MITRAYIAQSMPKGNNIYQFRKDGDTNDIIEGILDHDTRDAQYTRNVAKVFRGATDRETAFNIWNFLKTQIKYVEDPIGKQYIKTPSMLLQTGFGDCKSFSIFTGSVLRNLGIPYAYKFVTYGSTTPVPTHVYVIANPHTAPIVIDAVYDGPFGSEKKPYYRKKQYDMTKIYSVSGIGNAQPGTLDVGNDPYQLSDGELTLLIAKQRLELEKGIIQGLRGIGSTKAAKYDNVIELIEDALFIKQNPKLTEAQKSNALDIIERISSSSYNVAGIGSTDRYKQRIDRRRRIIGLAVKTPTVTASIGKKKKGLGKLFDKVKDTGKAIVKGAVKVITAPARLLTKGALELMIPNSGLYFLGLFADPSKMTDKGKRKREKQERMMNFIVKAIGMKKDHFLGLVRNGIMKKTGQTPETVIAGLKYKNKAGLRGIGAVPPEVLAQIGPAVEEKKNETTNVIIELLKGLKQIFGKKGEDPSAEDMTGSEDFPPDPDDSGSGDSGGGTGYVIPDDKTSNGGKTSGWC